MSAAPEAAKRPGRIVTFYSYKGGTGRSMAVANVAWILASHGKRVLVIDWDFEAPGLHRYFRPFLEDPDLVASPGLIDFFVDFAEAAVAAKAADSRQGTASAPGAEPWWRSRTSLLRYTYPLNDPLLEGEDDGAAPAPPEAGFAYGRVPRGAIHFVPAGRQGPEYALRVGGFDWRGFYDRLGGGVFLEALKERLRAEYDYVLVDSRTGISDTSGICTVQMPDDLVVCFTLNRQSLQGAAAVAESAEAQRRKPSGEPGLRIWPVPTRVELAERDRLEAARTECRRLFQRHLGRLPKRDRDAYWGGVEVLYQPYFAYEEVLAVFADRRRQTSSMLSSYERLCAYLTDGAVAELTELPENTRRRALGRFLGADGGATAAAGDDAAQRAWRAAKEAVAAAKEIDPALAVNALRELASRFAPNLNLPPADPDDPHKGRFGGAPTANDRMLVALLGGFEHEWLDLTLTVAGSADRPLKGSVWFNLHPTFKPDRVRVEAEATSDAPWGVARLKIGAWGAFTVGVECDDGATRLELDLATLPDAPQAFRER